MSINTILVLYALNAISVRAARVLLPLYMLELGAQPLAIGLLAASLSVLAMLLSVPAGKLADRFGSRWLLVIAAGAGGVGMLMPYFEPGVPAIFAAAMLIGFSIGIYQVIMQNLVGLTSKPEDRTRNFANFSLMASLANFIGPMVAGFSIDHFGHTTTCLVLAMFTVLPAAMFLTRGGSGPQTRTRQVKHEGGGIRNMLADPGVRRTLATTSLLHTGQDLYLFYMPVYAHALGFSASAIGVILATYSAAAFVVRAALPRLLARYTEDKLLAGAFFVSAACLLLIPLFKDAVVLAVISFIFGLAMGGCQPIITMIMFSNSAEGRSGETMGVRLTVIHFTKLVGPIAFGAVGSAFGLFPMFWLNAVMMGAGGMLSPPLKKPRLG